MKRNFVALVDMDGVLVDLLREWLACYKDVGGEYVPYESIVTYHWENSVKDKQLFVKCLESAGIFYSAKPLPGALDGLHMLRELTPHVHIVTKVMAGNSRAFDAKGGWLWRHVHPKFPRDQVTFTSAKHLVQGDYLIEDSTENINQWLAHNPTGHAFLVDQPYNQGYTHSRCTRVQNLRHAAWEIAQREYAVNDNQEVS